MVTITTPTGVPLVYDLVPASTDERLAAENIIDYPTGSEDIAAKGFIGQAWQTQIYQLAGNRVWTPKRSNQYVENLAWLDNFISQRRLSNDYEQLP